MRFENFLKKGRQIVAEHKAQYQGVYYMKGGIGGALEDVVGDTIAVVTGNPELIPLINAGVSAVNGGGIKGALEAGGEALIGQEIGGAVGLGEGNSTFNDALGITGDNPAGTGLPDIGAAASNALGGVTNALGITSPVPGATDNAATPDSSIFGGSSSGSGSGSTSTAGGSSASAGGTSVTPSSGGVTPASSAGDFSTSQINTQFANGFGGGDPGAASTAGSPQLGSVASNSIGATPSTSIGSTGGGISGEFASAAGGAPSLNTSGIDALAATPSVASAAPAATSASPSLLSQAESVGIKAIPSLGALAYDAIKGPAKLPSESGALAPGGAATAPLLGLETAAANEATTGQLTPTQQANIEQGVQQQQNALLQQLVASGVTNPTKDSRYIAGLQQIQQWALGQQQAYITQAISAATSAGGAASNNIATIANEQIQNDTSFQDSLAAAFGALGGNVGSFLPQKQA